MTAPDRGSTPMPGREPVRKVLESHESFEIVLVDGERWKCQLVTWDADDLLVSTATGTYVLPRHSIKYIVLEEIGVDVLERAAAEVPVLQEFLESPGVGPEEATVQVIDPPS